MLYGLVEGKVKIKSGNQDYIAFGRGKKNLIISMGLSIKELKGSGPALLLKYKIFADEYRVYFFDRRRMVYDGITNWDLAEDIYQAMNELKVETADVVGISQGGMIAMALTLEHPERVSRLVLAVTSSRTNKSVTDTVTKWVEYANKRDHVSINKEIYERMYSEQYLNKRKLIIPIIARSKKPKNFERFARLASATLCFNCYDRLQEIKCPVFVIGGEKDKLTTPQEARAIAEKLNCDIHMYPQYGHAAFAEAKDFNSRVLEFLKKT